MREERADIPSKISAAEEPTLKPFVGLCVGGPRNREW